MFTNGITYIYVMLIMSCQVLVYVNIVVYIACVGIFIMHPKWNSGASSVCPVFVCVCGKKC